MFTDPIENASDFCRNNMDVIVEVNLTLLKENQDLFKGAEGLDVCRRVDELKSISLEVASQAVKKCRPSLSDQDAELLFYEALDREWFSYTFDEPSNDMQIWPRSANHMLVYSDKKEHKSKWGRVAHSVFEYAEERMQKLKPEMTLLQQLYQTLTIRQ